AVQKKMQSEVAWADHIVLVYPTWWSSMPAVMKNWLDWTLDAGFAFRFTDEGKVEKLLVGKTARVFSTGDGPKGIYLFIRPLIAMIFGYAVAFLFLV
ncbi:MAG: NAD(P)H-dependent oxidoreductase, partial [Chloroflexota bacterium]